MTLKLRTHDFVVTDAVDISSNNPKYLLAIWKKKEKKKKKGSFTHAISLLLCGFHSITGIRNKQLYWDFSIRTEEAFSISDNGISQHIRQARRRRSAMVVPLQCSSSSTSR